MIYVDETKLNKVFALIKANPEINTEHLIDLIRVEAKETPPTQQLLFDDNEPEEKPKAAGTKVVNDIKSRQHWTRNEENELIAMKNSDRPNNDIARILQRSEKAVSQKIRKLVKEGKLDSSVKKSRHYTAEEKNWIKDLYNEHDSVKDISRKKILTMAQAFKRTEKAILDQLYILEREKVNDNE